MPSNNRAVLFDLDGTLLDTAPDLVNAANAVLQANGRDPLPLEALRPHVSNGARGLIAQAFPEADETRAAALAEALVEHYRGQLVVESELFPGMDHVLQALDAVEHPWGVVSNKLESLVRPILDHFLWSEHCACRIGGDTAAARKPDPAPIVLGARMMGEAPADCLYVGDSAGDVDAARAAGMPVVVVAWGYIPPGQTPQNWGADAVIERPEQLLEMVGLERAP